MMPENPFSSRTAWPAGTNPLALALETMRSDGEIILDLTESNPTRAGLKPPAGLLESFLDPANARYEPKPRGLLCAREAVAQYYRAKGVDVHPDRIFISASTSEAYSWIFRLLGDPSDGLIASKPGYPLIEYLAGINDLEIQSWRLLYSDGWKIDSSSLPEPGPKTRALVAVHPNNPAGHYVSAAERERLNAYCRRHGLSLIVDEVFYDFHWEAEPPAACFADNRDVLTFTLSGISKVLGLPQMKLSWIVLSGPDELCEEAARRLEIIADFYLSASTPVQNALPRWLADKSLTENIRQRVRANRAFLESQRGLRVLKASGGWYAVLQAPPGRNDEVWALELLKNQRVLVHPGYLFDFEEEDWLVIGLLNPEEEFREGLGRMAVSWL